jgi:hypothetical protein
LTEDDGTFLLGENTYFVKRVLGAVIDNPDLLAEVRNLPPVANCSLLFVLCYSIFAVSCLSSESWEQ